MLLEYNSGHKSTWRYISPDFSGAHFVHKDDIEPIYLQVQKACYLTFYL